MHRFLLVLPLAPVMGLKTGNVEVTPSTPQTLTLLADKQAALPTQADMEKLVKSDPSAALEACLSRYDREIKGYSATFQKQDFTDGRLQPTEVTEIHFREKPHSVYMVWKQGTRKAERVLFVEGENDNQMLARPAGRIARLAAGNVVARPVDGTDARSAGRYTLQQFGFKRTTEPLVKVWRQAREKGELQVEFLGVKRLKEAGDRPCWTWRSLGKKPDAQGISEVVVSVDTENWLQVGTVLKNEKGGLLGSYYFRDLKLNPEHKKDQFKRAALMP